MKTPVALLSLSLLLSAFSLHAAEVHPPQLRLPLMKAAPMIDGQVDEKEWAGAARMEGLGSGPKLAPLEASFWVGSDGKELFIAMVSETPPGGRIFDRVSPLPDNMDARTWLDDSVEVVIDPTPNAPTGPHRLFHANLNARGAIHDIAYGVGGNAEPWRGNWRTASKVVGDRWHFELALPLKDLGLAEGDLAGKTIGVRVCRNWQQTPLAGQTEWSPTGGAYLNPATIPMVTWDPAAPVVQALQLKDAGKDAAHIRLTVSNPGSAPLEVKVTVNFKPKSSAPVDAVKALKVGPGETVPVELNGSALKEDLFTAVRVASSDEKIVYYLREFEWRTDRPELAWAPDESAARKIQTLFAYYPSFNKVHFKVDLSNLDGREKVTDAKLVLRRKGTRDAIASANLGPFKKFTARRMWDVPSLKEGEYEVVTTLNGINADAIVVPFVRHEFPWERNRLGKSDVLVQSFTPIEVKGTTLATVLRRHTLSPMGLWDQVESLGRPLLESPMRLELTSGGQAVDLKDAKLKITSQSGTRVVTESQWSRGTLQLRTKGEWDYDGMMKWTIELAPCVPRVPIWKRLFSKPPPATPTTVDSLVLVIPLRDKEMPLFHACTDGLRFNYAGNTPAGPNRVWDGTKAPRNSIIGSYVPYIWLGAEERGVAVFGENDRGWVNAEKVPCQELVRRGNVLELRLNLIAKPTVIDTPPVVSRVEPPVVSHVEPPVVSHVEPRRILIGLQATPVKPMPKNWRRWAESYGTAVPPDGLRIAFNGSCWSWGALTPCLDVYPVNEDFTLFEKYGEARKTGKVDNAYLEDWLKKYLPLFIGVPEQTVRAHVGYGYRMAAGNPQKILLYTNARGVRFDTREGQTFIDEWYREAFSTRTWPTGGGVAYDLNPGESFRDYAVWYYKKMMTTFADSIYWDDIYLQACFDVIGSEAYELPDGRIQPSVGLFDMRELIRRTAVMEHELGRKVCVNQTHLTNTAVAPIQAFAATGLTWEDRSGNKDYQDRYTRDYIRTESIGRQAGNPPFVLSLVSDLPDPKTPEGKEKAGWVARTLAATILVHEIRYIGPCPADAILTDVPRIVLFFGSHFALIFWVLYVVTNI